MTDRAVMHCDDTRRPVTEKAEQAVDLFRRTFPGCEPRYLRVSLHDGYRLDGFCEVPVVEDPCVQKGNFYAVGRT